LKVFVDCGLFLEGVFVSADVDFLDFKEACEKGEVDEGAKDEECEDDFDDGPDAGSFAGGFSACAGWSDGFDGGFFWDEGFAFLCAACLVVAKAGLTGCPFAGDAFEEGKDAHVFFISQICA